MRRHFPLTFPSKRAAEAYLAAVRRGQSDARLVNLRRLATGWAACRSPRVRCGRSARLAVREGGPGGRCVCLR
jgi:hypothetical protein